MAASPVELTPEGTRSAAPPRRVRHAALQVVLPLVLAWGVTTLWHARLYPSQAMPAAAEDQVGAIRIRLQLPGTAEGIAEPVLVCGRTGRAVLVYIRLLAGPRAKVGVEYWGVGVFESEPFPLPDAAARIDVTCYLPALFPPADDRYWSNLAPALQAKWGTRYLVAVDGVRRLEGVIDYPQPEGSPVHVGVNPVGGDIVASSFSGRVIAASRR